MTTAEAWRDYERRNAIARRAYVTHMAELDHRALPVAERNRAKSARYYRTRKARP